MKKKLIVLSGFVLGLSPLVALAQATFTACSTASPWSQTIGTILCKISQIFTSVIPILIALGVIYFIWGVISYVISSDEEAKSAGRDKIIFGIIGLAVIIAVWGLVAVLTRTFGVDNPTGVIPPVLPVVPNS